MTKTSAIPKPKPPVRNRSYLVRVRTLLMTMVPDPLLPEQKMRTLDAFDRYIVLHTPESVSPAHFIAQAGIEVNEIAYVKPKTKPAKPKRRTSKR